MESHTLHFSISGEYLTRAAREAFHENGNFARAMDILKSAMVCDQLTERDIEQNCYDILNGRSQLCGIYPDGDYRYENIPGKEHACDMQDTMQAMYKKITELQDYANKLSRKYLFLFDNLPGYQQRQLQREYRDEFDENLFESVPEPDPTLSTLSDILSDSNLDGLSQSTRQELERLANDPVAAVDEFLTNTAADRDDEYGWLAPNGIFHPVQWGEHTAWADDYLQKHYPYIQNKDLYITKTVSGDTRHITGGDVLMYKLHWVLIDNPSQGPGRHVCDPDRDMTKAQREYLYEYYTDRGRTREANALYK